MLSAITTAELDAIVLGFAQGAHLAATLGFEVIQVHAAHGYLISQSLNPWLNVRTDEYGRPTALLERVLEAVRGAAPSCALDVRISLADGIGKECEERLVRDEQLGRIAKLGVDMISISSGMYEISRHLIYPARAQGWGIYVPRAISLARAYPNMKWNVAGNIWSLSSALAESPDNISVSIGRSLIADPLFIQKELSGDRSQVRACDFNGMCHYYTREEPHISCPVSDDLRPT